jgi:hypothetical protein
MQGEMEGELLSMEMIYSKLHKFLRMHKWMNRWHLMCSHPIVKTAQDRWEIEPRVDNTVEPRYSDINFSAFF